MNKITIYKAEADVPGLAEKIASQSSIAYCSPVEKWNIDTPVSSEMKVSLANCGIKASFKDLYFTKSILVSSNWNKNDDVFGKNQTWVARNTPVNKPTNLEHDEKQGVGHITSSWVVANDGKVIADDTPIENLPDLFHICNGAVIYMHWEDSELLARARTLVQQIEAGEKFVSMECLFGGFSYALMGGSESFILERNESTAFLTKHLRAYGGSGEYKEYRVGRVLENIMFSGKGYVDRPANPHSIIFNDESLFNFSEATERNQFDSAASVKSDNVEQDTAHNNILENNEMDEILKNQIAELKSTTDALRTQLAEAQQKAKEAAEAQFESKISALTLQVETANKQNKTDSEAVAALETKVKALEAQVTEVTASKQDLESKLAEEVAAKTKAQRTSILVDGGIAKETAETKVVVFASLNDEQFKVIADELVAAEKAKSAFPPADDKKKKEEEDKKKKKGKKDADASDESDANEDNADSDALDNADASDDDTINASGDDDGDEVEETRASLAGFIGAMLGKKIESSSEQEKN